MRRTKRFEIEGAVLEVPLFCDKLSKMDIPRYPDLLRYPVFTPAGDRVMLTIEDACSHADLQPGIYRDCGSCKHFKQADGMMLGVCHNPAMRRQEWKAGNQEEL